LFHIIKEACNEFNPYLKNSQRYSKFAKQIPSPFDDGEGAGWGLKSKIQNWKKYQIRFGN
jgi:hypothetical protein